MGIRVRKNPEIWYVIEVGVTLALTNTFNAHDIQPFHMKLLTRPREIRLSVNALSAHKLLRGQSESRLLNQITIGPRLQ